MKIVNTPKCSNEKLLKYARQLNRAPALGYESVMDYMYGYISCLRINKLINNSEANWLMKVYVNTVETDDGLATRYAINGKGQVVDYNDDVLPDDCEIENE